MAALAPQESQTDANMTPTITIEEDLDEASMKRTGGIGVLDGSQAVSSGTSAAPPTVTHQLFPKGK